MATLIPVGSTVSFSCRFVDSAGNPTNVDNNDAKPAEVQVAGPGEVTANADGLGGTLKVTGIGVGQVSVRADADRGDGIRDLIVMGDFEGIAGEAIAGTVEFSTPQ